VDSRWRCAGVGGDAVTGMVTYAWNDALFRSGDTNGKRINGTPEHRSFVTLDVALPLACRMGLAVEMNGAQMLDDANTSELQGFVTTNLRLRRAFRRAATYVQVDNVLDHGGAVSGYVLPFDGTEMLYPRMPRRVLLGFELTP